MKTQVEPLVRHTPLPAPTVDTEEGRRQVTLALAEKVRFYERFELGPADFVMVLGNLEVVEDRYELVHLAIEGASIGPETLRMIPVRSLIVAAARRHANVIVMDKGDIVWKDLADELTDEETVVALWHLARACRTNPNPMIRQQLRLSSDQAAARRVAALRKAGVLPPAEKKGQRY